MRLPTDSVVWMLARVMGEHPLVTIGVALVIFVGPWWLWRNRR